MIETIKNQASKSWYAIRVKSGQEQQVNHRLTDDPQFDTVESYLPLDIKGNALFTSYLFVKHSLADYHLTKYLPGLRQYVSFGQQLANLMDDDIQMIKKVEKHFSHAKSASPIKNGCKVKIIDGILTGKTGHVIEVKNQTTIFVEIKNVGLGFQLIIPKEQLLIL